MGSNIIKKSQHPNSFSKRIWELDFIRGVALLLMVYFHLVFDMNELYGYTVSYSSGINLYTGKISAILFIFVSGISCSLSRSNVKRGLKVLIIAFLISAATHLYDVEFGIKFGILHFLGISMLLYPLIKSLNKYILTALGASVIVLGYFSQRTVVSFDYLFPFGITSNGFVSSDYYPLLPWFGLFIFGVAFGKRFYLNKKSLFTFNPENNLIVKAVSLVGRKTLLIYIIHQPVTLAILSLFDLIKKR